MLFVHISRGVSSEEIISSQSTRNYILGSGLFLLLFLSTREKRKRAEVVG
jgi:hypothetical protein